MKTDEMRPAMPMQAFPRAVLRLNLAAARVPLAVAQAVLGHSGDAEWPPALAFEGFEAGVKRVVGRLLRDEVLVEEGRLSEAKVDKLRQAVDLDTVAEQRRQEAESTFEQRREEDQQRREQVATEAQEHKAAAARDEATAKRKAKAAAKRKAKAASEAEAVAAKAVERKARRSRVATLSAEEKALTKERAVVSRARAAKAVDKRLAKSKAVRLNGR